MPPRSPMSPTAPFWSSAQDVVDFDLCGRSWPGCGATIYECWAWCSLTIGAGVATATQAATLRPWINLASCRSIPPQFVAQPRSEEHTSELQSRRDLVCRLLLEKKN